MRSRGRRRGSAAGRRRRTAAIVGVVVLLVVGGLIVALRKGPSDGSADSVVRIDDDATVVQDETATAVVRRQDLRSEVQLRGETTSRSTPISVPSDGALTALVDAGATVARGQAVLHVEPPPAEVTEAERRLEDAELALRAARSEAASAGDGATSGATAAQLEVERAEEDLEALEATARDLVAPAAGTFTPVTGGYEVRQGLAVVAPLEPLALLRVRSGELQGTAEVQTVSGSTSTECASMSVTEGAAPASSGGEEDEPAAGSLVCTLGSELETVPGLPATVQVAIDLGTDVLVVPELAIGNDEQGAAFLQPVDGEPTPVELGPSDGVLRVVASGIEEGTEVELSPPEPG